MWGTREMEVRVVFFDVFMFLVGAFAGLIWLQIYGFHILPDGLGVVSGLVYGIVAVRFYMIRGIEENGEFQITRWFLAFSLPAAIVIVSPLLYFSLSSGLAGEKEMISFMYLFLLAWIATRIGLISNWERKQKRRIWFKDFWTRSLYASPETEKK
jgi:hypothetical protein